MSNQPVTYKFSTFQELVDIVPSDRIELCLMELGLMLATAKATSELVWRTAENLAKADGKEFPKMPEQHFLLPEVIEWIDDGKGELEPTFAGPNGEALMTLRLKKRDV